MRLTDDEVRFGTAAGRERMRDARRILRIDYRRWRRARPGGTLAEFGRLAIRAVKVAAIRQGMAESYEHECLVSMAQLALAEMATEAGSAGGSCRGK